MLPHMRTPLTQTRSHASLVETTFYDGATVCVFLWVGGRADITRFNGMAYDLYSH